MPSLPVIKQFITELISRRDAFRVPEPNLVMDDPEQVSGFHEAGREGGVMAPVYLFHAINVTEVIRPGDTVLDLGCGPANQLAMIARLNSDAQFIGLDLSDEMLARAQSQVDAQRLGNVKLRIEDITQLQSLADHSVDAIYSTVVLHQLPDLDAFNAVFKQIERVLKPGGGVYLVDFGHLKTERAIEYFAHQYADRQPDIFTRDYHNSLRAAFDYKDWQAAQRACLAAGTRLYSTFAMPYMVAVKSPVRHAPDATQQERFGALYRAMPDWHQRDFDDLRTMFRLGGLKLKAFKK
jgi:ubiquinone/menaquinone biosynthesis C-methylase UbiE